MSSITYRRLTNGDPSWGQSAGSFVSDIDAVRQAINTRLLLFQGEWWASTGEGLPLWQTMLGQSASELAQQQISSLITACILGTPFVIGVSNVQTSFDSIIRAFSYSAAVNTQFGTFQLDNLPQPTSGSLT